MKPTEQEIKDAADKAIQLKYQKSLDEMASFSSELEYASGYHAGLMDGMRAISQMQPEWVACDLANLPKENEYYSIWRTGYSPEETVARLFYHNGFKAYCFVDNSLNIYSIGEVVTHYKPLSQPPKD